jgi:hypothetical protein
MNSRSWKRLYAVGALAFAGAFVLLAGQKPAAGQDNNGEGRKLPGTWNVTLRFPDCTTLCPCPGGVPNIPIPALQTYLQDGSMLEVGGGSPLRGPGLGSWEHLGRYQFETRFKFFLFKPDGTRRGSEEVTSRIDVTGSNSFEANATFDLFDPAGNVISQGCPINETATRFE